MRKDPLNPKYTRVQVSIGLMVREATGSRLGSRNRGQFMDNRPRQNYRGNNSRGNTRGYTRQNNRGNYGNERYNDYNRDYKCRE